MDRAGHKRPASASGSVCPKNPTHARTSDETSALHNSKSCDRLSKTCGWVGRLLPESRSAVQPADNLPSRHTALPGRRPSRDERSEVPYAAAASPNGSRSLHVPPTIEPTCQALAGVSEADPGTIEREERLRAGIADCDRRIARHHQLLDNTSTRPSPPRGLRKPSASDEDSKHSSDSKSPASSSAPVR